MSKLPGCMLPAGGEKDIDFVRAMLKAGVGDEATIRSLATELNPERAPLLGSRLTASLRRP